jgi:hypothetical protein
MGVEQIIRDTLRRQGLPEATGERAADHTGHRAERPELDALAEVVSGNDGSIATAMAG